MEILLFLIPVALCLGGLGVFGFIWCMKNKQFDDPEGDARRILLDDEDGNG
ncbi:MAG: cbb3-type cytochrome oxidase assembly protein CcoS [Pseudomonadota bacterium]